MNAIDGKIGKLRERMIGIEGELGRLKGGRYRLPVEEVVQEVLPQFVQRIGASWLRSHGEDLLRAVADPATVGRPPLPWDTGGGGMPFGVLCVADEAGAVQILAALVEAAAANSTAPVGPRTSERAALITRLEYELAELDQEEEQLVDQAQAAGSNILHRLDVRRRRQEAQQARGSNDPDGRRRREAAIDAQPRRAVSAYLKQNE